MTQSVVQLALCNAARQQWPTTAAPRCCISRGSTALQLLLSQQKLMHLTAAGKTQAAHGCTACCKPITASYATQCVTHFEYKGWVS